MKAGNAYSKGAFTADIARAQRVSAFLSGDEKHWTRSQVIAILYVLSACCRFTSEIERAVTNNYMYKKRKTDMAHMLAPRKGANTHTVHTQLQHAVQSRTHASMFIRRMLT